MKKIIFTALILFLLMPGVARAQEETTRSANLRRIQELIEEKLQERAPSGQTYIGVLGSVLKVSTSTFTIVDSRGRERTVEIDNDTPFLSGKKTIALKDLSINSSVVVVGQATDEIIIDALRVYISETDFTETRRVFLGTISQWNRRNLTITARGSSNEESFVVNARTAYQDNTGAKITANDIDTEQAVLIIARDDSGARTITTVRLLAPLDRE